VNEAADSSGWPPNLRSLLRCGFALALIAILVAVLAIVRSRPLYLAIAGAAAAAAVAGWEIAWLTRWTIDREAKSALTGGGRHLILGLYAVSLACSLIVVVVS
jgi:hypothetical protein